MVTSGQVSGQLSHQQKHGCNLQQQCNQCGSFSWQQPSQSQHVSHPQLLPQLEPLLHELDDELQLGELAALQLLSAGAALLQLLLLSVDAAGAGAAGAAGAGAACCADAL